MGVASLVLGIISLVLGWIPFLCFFIFILAVIGLVLGIVDTIKKNKTNDKRRGISIAGLIVSAIAIPIIITMSFLSIGIFAAIVDDTSYDYDYNYNRRYDDDDWYDNWNNNYRTTRKSYDIL